VTATTHQHIVIFFNIQSKSKEKTHTKFLVIIATPWQPHKKRFA